MMQTFYTYFFNYYFSCNAGGLKYYQKRAHKKLDFKLFIKQNENLILMNLHLDKLNFHKSYLNLR